MNFYHGSIYSWFSKFLGDTPFLGELFDTVKNFNRFFDESDWSPLKLPKLSWNDLVSPANDATRSFLVDRPSGYEYEFGTNKPPPFNITRLIYNYYPYRDHFVDKGSVPRVLNVLLLYSTHCQCLNLPAHSVWITEDIGENGEGPIVLLVDESLSTFAHNAILYARSVSFVIFLLICLGAAQVSRPCGDFFSTEGTSPLCCIENFKSTSRGERAEVD